MEENLINVDHFKRVYYKALLPLDKINDFLHGFNKKEIETVTITLISIFDVSISDVLLDKLSSFENKVEFLRLCQDDYSNLKILDYLIDKFPDSEEIIKETIDRSLLASKTAVK